MAVYTVHAPDESQLQTTGDLGTYTERFVFIPERFSLLATLFALPWLLVHRLWLASLGFVALVVALNLIGAALGLNQQTLGFFSLALSVIVGFEAHNLRRLSLERSGYRLAGVVSASSRQEAERKFFSEWLRERGQALEARIQQQTGNGEAAATA
ncbi:DUF2628 domain-containing protein [Dichotomicrobium thermohalophilum]|uniref:Uncharacterized protein DUF2628 n=1 Tax=Dichotomicrobium thermohalophilum TaxID=933063 RepID=A0A397Q8J7_9HYPH|nr:DUF2628 domain-containing protein [Dichotomicrobium thermohalophilum]RIA55857.1 uncharacterized protein DUF2628 [Dichotomicrobium thermohalophilum]